MPLMVMVSSPKGTTTLAPLARVSVVRMPSPAAAQPSGPSSRHATPRAGPPASGPWAASRRSRRWRTAVPRWPPHRRVRPAPCKCPGVAQANLAGASIGVSSVDHQIAWRRAAGGTGRQVLTRHRHRRGAKGIAREGAGHGGAFRHLDHHQVTTVRCLDARHRRAQPQPLDPGIAGKCDSPTAMANTPQ